MSAHLFSGPPGTRVVGLAATGALVSALIAGSVDAAASTNSGISGSITLYAAPAGIHFQQLVAGSDGHLWFVTANSQLGEIASTGQATLTGVVLPHANTAAVIAGAGPMGVWSYANNTATSPVTCAITLVTPQDAIHPITIPSPATNSFCGGAATDGSGNLWLSLSNLCGSFTCGHRVSFVAEVAPGGLVTLFQPVKPGARTGPVTLGSDAAIWVLGGYPSQVLGRYTSTGATTGIPVSPGALTGLFARPDGTFWGTRPVLCIGQKSLFCLRVVRFAPGGTTSPNFIFPVGINLSGSFQLGVDSGGGLWQAGGERTQPNRFFRMNGDGSVDRSAAFPTVSGGSTLSADGTIAIDTAGAIWATASSTSGAEFVLRFVPLA